MIYPSVIKNSSVFGPQAKLIGTADIVLPKITFEKSDLKGLGLGGSMNLPISGNVTAMSSTITFHTNTPQSLALFSGQGQQIRCLSSVQMVDTSKGTFQEFPEEVTMTVFNSEYDPGKRDTSTKGQISVMFDVTYLALTFGGKKYWEIDPFAGICIVNGVDLNTQTRINIGN